ncbi:lytic transglycosylase domain-containing protein [Puniceibacterium sediminis]|uniref:Transglycosylase SLT domain-containing protein n=1 Tax=Puniceibacterium sediminis TaxID=1608407 RepID=A0A238VJK3_9RHOB|nr:lytic transglycosylase domain-containing protein [Puniceibacterium sediminis]SNR34361.1 Transglycosylase SLT domain-containing protein [Puniceibacterium sediminis]
MHSYSRRAILGTILMSLAACSSGSIPEISTRSAPLEPPLYPNETRELRKLINKYADLYGVPRPLVHRLAIRESTHRPGARNGPYYGLMQILPATARGMGHKGSASDLLDPETNLKYAVKYLRGAWLLANGSYDTAVKWYSQGYYYEAKRRGLLAETGLRA